MKDKFKGMSKRELAEYVWDYYKVHIIATVIGALVIGSLINSIFIHPADKQYVGVIIYGEPVEWRSITALEELLTDTVVPGEMKPGYAAMVDNFYRGGNAQADMGMTQKFAALMMVGEVDIIILNREEFDTMTEEGNFAALSAEQAEAFADRLIEEARGQVYGVDMTGARALEDCGVELENPVAGFAVSGKQPEIALSALRVLIEGR